MTDLPALENRRDIAVLDTRAREAFFNGHLAGSLLTELDYQFCSIAGSYVAENTPIYLVVDEARLDEAVRALIRVGLDRVVGYVTPETLAEYGRQGGLGHIKTIDMAAFEEQRILGRAHVLDVRSAAEFEAGHVEGALHVPHTRIAVNVDRLPTDKPLLVYCNSGARAAAAVSMLQRLGQRDRRERQLRELPARRRACRACLRTAMTPDVTAVAPISMPTTPSEPAVATLQTIEERTRAIVEVAEGLRPLIALAQQAPRSSRSRWIRSTKPCGPPGKGIDVERGLLNGAEAALRFGATMDAERVRELDALLKSGVLEPGTLRVVGELGRALTETAAAPPATPECWIAEGAGAAGRAAGAGLPGDVRRTIRPPLREPAGRLTAGGASHGHALRSSDPRRRHRRSDRGVATRGSHWRPSARRRRTVADALLPAAVDIVGGGIFSREESAREKRT